MRSAESIASVAWLIPGAADMMSRMIIPPRAAVGSGWSKWGLLIGVSLVMSSSVVRVSSVGAPAPPAPATSGTDARVWPSVPAPKLVYVTSAPQQTDPDARVMEQTLAGLLAF